MKKTFSTMSQSVRANPTQINTLLNEYLSGHRALVPKPYCIDIMRAARDESSSLVTVKMNISGVVHEFQEYVENGIPARIIIEFDSKMDVAVAIVVKDADQPHESLVTISTFSANSPFLTDFFDGLCISESIRQIYYEESPYIMGVDTILTPILQAV